MADDRGARARGSGALARFRTWLRRLFPYFVFFVCWPVIAPAADCPADRVDETAHVDAVHDGDTLRLRDGRRLRLIGLDTPELGRDGQPDQPLAVAARDVLRHRLPADAALRLRYDAEREDAHGRTLAHLFFADGTSVTAWLLEQGLATLLLIPPDLWNADCYAAAERRARERGLGVWALPDYQPVAAACLPRTARGYRVVQGSVLRVREGDAARWLILENQVAVRIDRHDLAYFSQVRLNDLARRPVEVRGWVYPVGDELHIKLRHPAQLDIVSAE
ncbi:MAG: thermonuclease family protein [Pseudomonadota bacterium]